MTFPGIWIRVFPWVLAALLGVVCWRSTRPAPPCPAASAAATASVATKSTEVQRTKTTVTVPASSTPSTIVIESTERTTTTARTEASAKVAAATARRAQWVLGLSARFQPSLSGLGRPTSYAADLAARVADSPFFVVLGAERMQDGGARTPERDRWNVSLGVRYEW